MKFNEFIFSFILFFMFIAVAILISSVSGIFHCQECGKQLGLNTEWHYWTGCVVTTSDNKKVLLKQIREYEVE